MIFRVAIPVSGYVEYIVDAEDAEDAKQCILDGYGDFHYPHELNEDIDSNNWEIYND